MAVFGHSSRRLVVLAFCLSSTSPFGANAENADVDGVCTADSPCLTPEVEGTTLLQRGFQTAESKTMKSSQPSTCKDYPDQYNGYDEKKTFGATDEDGNECSFYYVQGDKCGLLDDDDFIANEMCCHCGGGSTSTLSRSIHNSASVFVSEGSCPDGFDPVSTLAACRAALDMVGISGMDYNGAESAADYPKGCYFCRNVHGCKNGVWFNEHPQGGPVEGVRQICQINYDPKDVKKLFVGDSDIDFWDSSPHFRGSYNVGVGGYTTSDVTGEVDKWVAELDPEWVVIVCGENDFSGLDHMDMQGRRGETMKAFARFTSIVQKFIQDGSRVVYLGTKPEPGSTELYTEYNFYDNLVRGFATQQAAGKSTPPLVMIDVFEAFSSDPDLNELFNTDDLHMSRLGYQYWNQWVKLAMDTPGSCIRWRHGQCMEVPAPPTTDHDGYDSDDYSYDRLNDDGSYSDQTPTPTYSPPTADYDWSKV